MVDCIPHQMIDNATLSKSSLNEFIERAEFRKCYCILLLNEIKSDSFIFELSLNMFCDKNPVAIF